MRGVVADVQGRPSHADRLMTWLNDPLVVRWMSFPDATYSRADIESLFSPEREDALSLVFEDAGTGELVGCGSVYEWDSSSRSAEISWSLPSAR
eukprot:m51a1_g13368 hypothetical protein (94) ;mRNA; f:3322-3778